MSLTIMIDNCLCQVSDAAVHDQMTVFNNEVGGLAGTTGANSPFSNIQFKLVTEDQQGNPTTGINRYVNDEWYRDILPFTGPDWVNSVPWNTSHYLNIMTSSAQGLLGYVNFLPNSRPDLVGNPADILMLNNKVVGRKSDTTGFPGVYDMGRAPIHELSHWLGLLHPFQGGYCPTAANGTCWQNQDLICETPPQDAPYVGCPAANASLINNCSTVPTPKNFMDFWDDVCMDRYTPQQVARMRCTLVNYRPDLLKTLTLPKPKKNNPSTGAAFGASVPMISSQLLVGLALLVVSVAGHLMN